MTPLEINRLVQALHEEIEPFIKLLVRIEAEQPFTLVITKGGEFPDSVEHTIHWTPEGVRLRDSILEFIERQKAALEKAIIAAGPDHMRGLKW